MIFAKIEQRRRIGREASRGFELKTRQLQHHYLGHRSPAVDFVKHIQHWQTVVTRHYGVASCRGANIAAHRCDRALAVRSGDGDDFGFITTRCNRLRKQLDIAHHRRATFDGRTQLTYARIKTGTDCNHVSLIKITALKLTGAHGDAIHCACCRQMRRRRARIQRSDARTLPRQPARHRVARVSQSQHQHFLTS